MASATSQHVLRNIGEQLQTSFVTALQKIFNYMAPALTPFPGHGLNLHMLILVIYFNDMSEVIYDFLGNPRW